MGEGEKREQELRGTLQMLNLSCVDSRQQEKAGVLYFIHLLFKKWMTKITTYATLKLLFQILCWYHSAEPISHES